MRAELRQWVVRIMFGVLIWIVVGATPDALQAPLHAQQRALTPLHSDVRVDVSCGGSACTTSSLADSNRTRKLVVSAAGTISALFWNTSGMWVASSTDRGASFGVPKLITSTPIQGELAMSANGTMYVSWNDANTLKLAKSSNAGTSWTTTTVATGVATNYFGQAATFHMAVDGEYVYLLHQTGRTVYVSSDAAATWSTKTVSGVGRVFADIHVDPLSHTVYAFLDDPSIYWYMSTDHGLTWGSEKTTGRWVSYSVGALTSNGTTTYVAMSGSEGKIERFNVGTNTAETKTVNTSSSNTRSLAADSCGNFVSGTQTGTDLMMQYSTDGGDTFSTAERVVASGDRANASINTTNGDVLFLYQKSGHIYLTTYAGILTGGSGCYALALSHSAFEFTTKQQTQTLTLTNTTASALPVTAISISGTAITQTNTCGASIAAGASCAVQLTATDTASETLTLDIGGVVKKLPVNLSAAAAVRPTMTATRVSTPTRTPTPTTVIKRTQTISFANVVSQKLLSRTLTLTATASSGLPVRYTTTSTAICSVSGAVVTLKKVGTCVITATQPGGSSSGMVYAAAKPVVRSFKIIK